MKVQIFKNKSGEIGSWCAGNAHFAVKFDDHDGSGEYEAIKEEHEVTDEEYLQLTSGTHEAYLVKGKAKVAEKLIEKEKRSNQSKLDKLKTKLDAGKTITNKEIRDALKLLIK